MESQKFGHQHPLVFNQSDDAAVEDCCCSRCGEAMFGPSFSCADCDQFQLHKECAEAPEEIHHPLHRDHPFCLLPTPPYESRCFCNFCGEEGEKFVYHCSCDLDLHIKCALFTYKFAQGDLAYKDPSISTEEEVERLKCSGCWKPLLDSASYYDSLDHGFKLHKKCVELSFQIKYPLHHDHLLSLQFYVQKKPCIICHDMNLHGLCYSCLPCNFSIHIACMSPPSIIVGDSNQHPFTLLFRHMNFTCDACGVERNSVPYMSSGRNLLVHRDCISLPPIIKFKMHEHLLFHSYFITRDESSKFKNWDCVLCLDKVNANHGSYYCSECHFILHVNCATMNIEDYTVIESAEEFNKNRVLPEPSYIVIERNEGEEATEIKHFTHQHNLILLSGKFLVKGYEFCDGCTFPILDSFYSCCCSECNFSLHKNCVEFPKRKYFWFKKCEEALNLSAGRVFKCDWCCRTCNGFAYECPECYEKCCLGCATLMTLTRECEGHQHPLRYFRYHEGSCTNCDDIEREAYICKICKVAFCCGCMKLPSKTHHKCDEHLLSLTYHDDNTYSGTHFCDICEESRSPNPWFYSCATCDTSVHSTCIAQRGNYYLIKLGKMYRESEHPHPVKFVKKKYYYPKCFECDDPCQELALECTEPTCDYIVNWECICSPELKE